VQLIIREYQCDDAATLTDIFYQTIHQVGIQHYTSEQVAVWAPLPIDYQKWQLRFNQIPPLVAVYKNMIIGFMSLETDGHIQWAYCHHNYQKQGIATALFLHIERLALKQGIKQLYTEASYFAQPFFTKHGFQTCGGNKIQRLDSKNKIVWLTNFSMNKKLAKK
jgi:putative acetyltransferase